MKDLMGKNSRTFQDNEEYKAFLVHQNRKFAACAALGFLTAVFAVLMQYLKETGVSAIRIGDYMLGVYEGTGVGLMVAAIIKWVRNLRLIKNEERLAEQRRAFLDERIREISRSAMQLAAWIMLGGMYLAALVGGVFYPSLAKILLWVICLMMVIYVVSYRVLEKRM